MLDDSLLGPNLRELLPLWDEALIPTSSDALIDAGSIVIRFEGATAPPHVRFLLTQRTAKSASQRAADQLNNIGEMLDVPIRDVCKAAGVPRRTYYAWRKKGSAVRLGAANRIEDLHLAVQDLQEMLGDDLKRWIRGSRQMSYLRSGRFDELLSEAMTRRTRTRPMEGVPDWSNATAVDWPSVVDVDSSAPGARRAATRRTNTYRRNSQDEKA
ncbi:hypothetical protein [Terrabacter sp. NPDC080008]|uniref:hypothetical protein n=1 Tax=Terrabacter sp. NPDC080008 TaxID=3155176 RepID=UPI003450BB54